MAVVQFVDDLFRGSPYSEKSKNDHANTSSVNDGHFDSVPRFSSVGLASRQLSLSGVVSKGRAGSYKVAYAY